MFSSQKRIKKRRIFRISKLQHVHKCPCRIASFNQTSTWVPQVLNAVTRDMTSTNAGCLEVHMNCAWLAFSPSNELRTTILSLWHWYIVCQNSVPMIRSFEPARAMVNLFCYLLCVVISLVSLNLHLSETQWKATPEEGLFFVFVFPGVRSRRVCIHSIRELESFLCVPSFPLVS